MQYGLGDPQPQFLVLVSLEIRFHNFFKLEMNNVSYLFQGLFFITQPYATSRFVYLRT